MLQRLTTWLATLKGAAMNKSMVGDVVMTVIDEIGEVTFFRDPMYKDTVEIGKKETAARAIAAVVEAIEICELVVGVSRVGAKLTSAKELLLVNFEFHVNLLIEQTDFNSSVRKG